MTAKVWVKSLLALNCHWSALNFYSGCTRENLNAFPTTWIHTESFRCCCIYTKTTSYWKSCHLSNLSEWSVPDVCGDITAQALLSWYRRRHREGTRGLENLSKTSPPARHGAAWTWWHSVPHRHSPCAPRTLVSLRRARRILGKSHIHEKLEAHCFQEGLRSEASNSLCFLLEALAFLSHVQQRDCNRRSVRHLSRSWGVW